MNETEPDCVELHVRFAVPVTRYLVTGLPCANAILHTNQNSDRALYYPPTG